MRNKKTADSTGSGCFVMSSFYVCLGFGFCFVVFRFLVCQVLVFALSCQVFVMSCSGFEISCLVSHVFFLYIHDLVLLC